LRRLKRVILENFQSHRYTELLLAPTVTVFIGESDQGKSAIVRALRWLLYNKPQGADFIRVGADYCRVSTEFDDGLVISRERRGKTNRYEIRRPGQDLLVLEGFGRDVPAEVEELTAVRALKLEGAAFELHIAHQLDPPFILRETPAVRARAVGHLSGTQLFDAADKRAGRKLAGLSRRRQELEEQLEQLEAELQNFAGLELVEQLYDRCAGLHGRSEAAGKSAVKLAGFRDRFRRIAAELRQNQELLRSLPEVNLLQGAYDAAAQKCALWRRVWLLRERREKVTGDLARSEAMLTATANLPVAAEIMSATAGLTERVNYFTVRKLRHAALKQDIATLKKMLEGLQPVARAGEELGVLQGREAVLTAIRVRQGRRQEILQRLRREEAVLAQLAGVAEAEGIAEGIEQQARLITVLANLNQRFRVASRELPSMVRRLGEAQERVERLGAEMRESLLTAKRCPLCLSPLSAERIEEILVSELGEKRDE
jgi:exonuclease SbcC